MRENLLPLAVVNKGSIRKIRQINSSWNGYPHIRITQGCQTRNHIRKLHICYKNSTIIKLSGIPLTPILRVRPTNQPTTTAVALCPKKGFDTPAVTYFILFGKSYINRKQGLFRFVWSHDFFEQVFIDARNIQADVFAASILKDSEVFMAVTDKCSGLGRRDIAVVRGLLWQTRQPSGLHRASTIPNTLLSN